MTRPRLIVTFALVSCYAHIFAPAASAGLIAAYNEEFTPSGTGPYWPHSIGWLWEATATTNLTRIETIFAYGPEQTIGVEVHDGLPHEGGTLLASGSYEQVGGEWGGADLGPVPITAGERYFIALTNVVGLGVSFVEYDAAVPFSIDGLIHYDTDALPPASYTNEYVGQNKIRIRLYGVPEPSASCLFALGCALATAASGGRSGVSTGRGSDRG